MIKFLDKFSLEIPVLKESPSSNPEIPESVNLQLLKFKTLSTELVRIQGKLSLESPVEKLFPFKLKLFKEEFSLRDPKIFKIPLLEIPFMDKSRHSSRHLY